MGAGGQAYKGDVSEVLMGHETGIYIEHGEPCGFTTSYNSSTPDFNTITFTGSHASNVSISENAILKVPVGMLIGQKISFHNTTGGSSNYDSVIADGLSQRVDGGRKRSVHVPKLTFKRFLVLVPRSPRILAF